MAEKPNPKFKRRQGIKFGGSVDSTSVVVDSVINERQQLSSVKERYADDGLLSDDIKHVSSSFSYGKERYRQTAKNNNIGATNTALGRTQSSVVSTRTIDVPSDTWAYLGPNRNSAYVVQTLSASDHEVTSLNLYRSGSRPLETSPVPASSSIYYSKHVGLQTIVVKKSASFFDTVPRQSGTYVPTTFAAGSGTFVNFITGTNTDPGGSDVCSTSLPASIFVDVPVSGKLVDIKVWVELMHVSGAGRYFPLGMLGLAVRNPNVSWGHAHPIRNDDIYQTAQGKPITIDAFYRDTFLLWESGFNHFDWGPWENITYYVVPSNFGTNVAKYPAWQRDRSMRTVFHDNAATLNPRHLYSPTSPSGNFIGSPNASFGLNSAYGFDVPWTSNETVAHSPYSPVAGSPPKGWLSGPANTAANNEWPTTGSNYGAETIRPLYPLLDSIFCKKVIGTEASYDGGQLAAAPPDPLKLRGFRPGLAGSEISGSWELLIVNNNYGGVSSNTTLLYFRQVRLELTYETADSTRPTRSTRDIRRYRAKEPGELYQHSISGSDSSNAGTSAGSGLDYFKNDIYTTQPLASSIGRTFRVMLDVGNSASQGPALLYKLTGSLALISGAAPGWLLNNEFKMPSMPVSSASLVIYSPPSGSTAGAVQAMLDVKKGLSPVRLAQVADDMSPKLSRVDIAARFVSSSTI